MIGRDINALLPQGSAARRWRTLMTEVQMLFHAHPVNRAREEQQPFHTSAYPPSTAHFPPPPALTTSPRLA